MPEHTYVYFDFGASPLPTNFPSGRGEGPRHEAFVVFRLLRDALGGTGTKKQMIAVLETHPQMGQEFKGTSKQSIEQLLETNLCNLKRIGAIGVLPTVTQGVVQKEVAVVQEAAAVPQQSSSQSYYQRQKAEHEAFKAKYEALIGEHQVLKAALEAAKAESDALKAENLALKAKISNGLSAKLIVSDLESRLQILRTLIE
jgi:hypothetical protein